MYNIIYSSEKAEHRAWRKTSYMFMFTTFINILLIRMVYVWCELRKLLKFAYGE